MEQSFTWGDFTGDIIKDTKGKNWIGFIMAVFGAFDAAGSVVMGKLADRLGKRIYLIVGFAAHMTFFVFYLVFLNVAHDYRQTLEDKFWILFLTAALLGIADSCWCTFPAIMMSGNLNPSISPSNQHTLSLSLSLSFSFSFRVSLFFFPLFTHICLFIYLLFFIIFLVFFTEKTEPAFGNLKFWQSVGSVCVFVWGPLISFQVKVIILMAVLTASCLSVAILDLKVASISDTADHHHHDDDNNVDPKQSHPHPHHDDEAFGAH